MDAERAQCPRRCRRAEVIAEALPEQFVPIDNYVVVAGDSYWKIAEDHLDPSAAAVRSPRSRTS